MAVFEGKLTANMQLKSEIISGKMVMENSTIADICGF